MLIFCSNVHIITLLHSFFIGIIKQNRLTVVVNKMDTALLPKYGSTYISRKELVSKVRHHLCEKVFHCSEENLPGNMVIPVCGNWAFYGRNFQINPGDRVLEQQIDSEVCRICAAVNEENKKRYSEFTSDEKAKYLESASHIDDLENR